MRVTQENVSDDRSIVFSSIFLRQEGAFFKKPALQELRSRWESLSHEFDACTGEYENIANKRQNYGEVETTRKDGITHLNERRKAIRNAITEGESNLDALCQELGQSICEAGDHGSLDTRNLFEEKKDIEQNIKELKEERISLSGAKGILGKAKAMARTALIEGKIFLLEGEIKKHVKAVGKEIISGNRESQYVCPRTDILINRINSIKEHAHELRQENDDLANQEARLEQAKKDRMIELEILDEIAFLKQMEDIDEHYQKILYEISEKGIDLFYETYLILKDVDLEDQDLKQIIDSYTAELDALRVNRDANNEDSGKWKKPLAVAGIVGFGAFNIAVGGLPALIVAGVAGGATSHATKYILRKIKYQERTTCLCYRCDNPGPHNFTDMAKSSAGGIALGMAGGALVGIIGTLMSTKMYSCRKCGAILKNNGRSVWLADEAIKRFRDYPELQENLEKLQMLIAAKDENIKCMVVEHNEQINQLEQVMLSQKITSDELLLRTKSLINKIQESQVCRA